MLGFGNRLQQYTKVFQGDNMRRFDYDDNEEFRDDVDKFFDENSSNYDDFIAEEFALEQARIDIAHRDIDYKIMRTAVRFCEKTFMWSFYSLPTRLKMIADTYEKLRKLEE